jgi:PEP-CTERM motif
MKPTQKMFSLNSANSKPRFSLFRISACAIAFALLTTENVTVFGAETTVSALNPTPPAVGIVDSPANVGNASFVTQATMTLAVANAFNNNTGGVIDWEPANGWSANTQNALSQTVSYGTSQANLLTITRNDGAGNTFGPTTGSGSPTTSGVNYLGFSGVGSPVTLNFSTGLVDWGMTQLDRFASRSATFTFTLADNSTITYAAQTQDPSANNTGADNWYGFQASASNPLVSVGITANGFVRFDDMAFVVAAPEPGSMVLLGMGCITGLVAYRRRSSSR